MFSIHLFHVTYFFCLTDEESEAKMWWRRVTNLCLCNHSANAFNPYLTMSVVGCVWQGQGQRYILADFAPLTGPWMEEFKTPAPNPEIFSLCDGYSALRPAELVHKNELCKMKRNERFIIPQIYSNTGLTAVKLPPDDGLDQ
ncbi:hypothetical protein MG293_013663 [Ovis ammon polii]|uniref:Uncharacterized protein n=1 Tax=Ovis ammon polii TaxID=230172 RepID=A0AAD4TZH9_OVIAM|nr:hypothetical protein MG293_013663 [Ovis ammon polii]KAI4557375.1 hypothetical protein MJT46_014054 [Ovis ammon polii x Ovis aries]